MKLFGIIFLSIGLLFAFIGLGWIYVFISSQTGTTLSEEWIGPGIFTFIGLLFASIGGGVLYFIAKQKAKRELLIRTGKKLRAAISNVYYNTSITVNNRHPLIIECVAEVSGKKKTFKSHNIWNQNQFSPGQEIAVYLDTRDSTNFWVEVGN
ncbi:MAG: hypothetical protein IPK96_10690 [Flammeovirgaceae bacterium]|jgi:hypothetical protein|nr:hypothetical protein [Flammeovirgaceae bacterium]